MSVLNDQVLKILLNAPANRLQRKAIMSRIAERRKIKKGTSAYQVLNTTLYRALTNLVKKDFLEKDDRGHKNVYYYIPDEFLSKANKFLQRQRLGEEWLLSLYPKSWGQELRQTRKLLRLIIPLKLEECRKLQTLLENYIKLEEFEQREREGKYEIVDVGDKIELRDRQTGRAVAVIHVKMPK